jgi:hypothetical protein
VDAHQFKLVLFQAEQQRFAAMAFLKQSQANYLQNLGTMGSEFDARFRTQVEQIEAASKKKVLGAREDLEKEFTVKHREVGASHGYLSMLLICS